MQLGPKLYQRSKRKREKYKKMSSAYQKPQKETVDEVYCNNHHACRAD